MPIPDLTACPARWERPGGRQRGDRLVACHLQSGHEGEHEEEGTDVTWTDAGEVSGYVAFCGDQRDDQLGRHLLAVRAERDQYAREVAYMRGLIDQFGDDGMIPASALREAFRDGPSGESTDVQ
jgi:hypothetical protein